MKFALCFAAGCAVSSVFAQNQIPPVQAPKPFKIVVRHADPYFIKAMLEGSPVLFPELSTQLGFVGLPNVGQAVNALFKNGKIVVNPTDNTLWFFPDPPSA